jgi:hypothetical protein
MDLTPYVESLREELASVADAAGEEVRVVADRLTTPLAAAIRLVLLEALSAAAGEITRELAPGSVEVRLRGREPSFVVVSPPADQAPIPDPPAAPAETEEGAVARINLRVPESLKPRVEERAARDGLSVNAWLVRLIATALDHDDRPRRPRGAGSFQVGQRITGWVR